ncbi:MAG: trehalose utilization [Alphaproteobacteria bacterium 64-11]|nr:ThuA domain-containing protein [Alphaproteobacteria bacterium]OJU11596.1 MAG: trehalose utilization [Alphaproteobacteria bacterium 64-11]
MMLWSGVAMAAPIKVMILDGESAAAYHNWPVTTAIMKRELEDAGIFDVTVVSAPRSDSSEIASFDPEFQKYQVVVWNYDAPDWPQPLKDKFEAYMKNGGGLVVVHAADNAFPNWPAWNEMNGLGGWRGRDAPAGPRWFYDNGKLTSDAAPGPAGMHGKRLPFRMTTRAPDHPIMRGLPENWMHMGDELYSRLRGPGHNMAVLATAWSDPANKGSGHDEPMLMALTFGKGRIFHTTLGHDAWALSGVGFMTTFQRGTEWAATGRVTQKVPKNFPAADVVSYRADLAAMDPAIAANGK